MPADEITEKKKPGRKKLDPAEFRRDTDPLCNNCHKNKRALARHIGKVYLRKWCHSCMDKKYKDRDKVNAKALARQKKALAVYRSKKMFPCTECGYKPRIAAEMDWDHIDGNRYNNVPENLQLLCANCHRYKTHKNKDYGAHKYTESEHKSYKFIDVQVK